MERYDRLTTLIDRFRLSVAPAEPGRANLLVVSSGDGTPERAVFGARGALPSPAGRRVLFAAEVNWSGPDNPFLVALPDLVEFVLADDPDTVALVGVMQAELAARRCGAGSVLNRLGEVLIVRMMRAQIEAGSTEPGLLAGLCDPRLSRALVAMHDLPGRAWRNEDLARISGMSLSRFAEMFARAVGEPPAAYLRRWRMTLARQDIARGDRVEAVARRYGFSSAEGFSRAFTKHHGTTPIALRTTRGAGDRDDDGGRSYTSAARFDNLGKTMRHFGAA